MQFFALFLILQPTVRQVRPEQGQTRRCLVEGLLDLPVRAERLFQLLPHLLDLELLLPAVVLQPRVHLRTMRRCNNEQGETGANSEVLAERRVEEIE